RLLIDLRNRTSRGPRMAGSDAAVFHLVDPITGFGNGRIMGGQEQGFLALLHNILKQLKGALRVGSVEIAGRFVRQNDSRIIGERAYDTHTLLFLQRDDGWASAICRPSQPARAKRLPS